MKAVVEVRPDMPRGLVRVPHGWWTPEAPPGREDLSGAWHFADGQLCDDAEDLLDREQGVPHLKKVPGVYLSRTITFDADDLAACG